MSSYGFTSIRVLRDLERKPWNEITQAFVTALRPESVRVIKHNGTVTSDGRLWRVTVFLTAFESIEKIEQEVEVALPDGVAHGYDLERRLEAQAALPLLEEAGSREVTERLFAVAKVALREILRVVNSPSTARDLATKALDEIKAWGR